MYAEVFYFDEFNLWAVTLYTASGHRVRDLDNDEIEAAWFAFKSQAVASADELLRARDIVRYDVYTRDGRLSRAVLRKPHHDQIEEVFHV